MAEAQNSQQINTQGIAYILLAKHYATGNFGLAVSSYWSPLLSWLLSLGLKAGCFGWERRHCCLCVGLSAMSFLIGVWLAGFAAVVWSVEYIGPDLLGAALLLLVVSGSLLAIRFRSRKEGRGCGRSF